MANIKSTLRKLKITPRTKMKFGFDEIKTKYWFDGNSLLTTYFTALSATFPPGEQNFIDSVRYYRDQITDETLLAQIRGFIGQEGHHSRQHRLANKVMDEMGLYASRIEEHLRQDIIKFNKHLTPEQQLAATVCMEHITAIMAEHALTIPEMTEHMHESVRELILWHAVEEIEHKAVAFDVFEQCVGDREMLRRAMIFTTLEFTIRSSCYQAAILYWDKKIPSLRDVAQAGKFFFGKKGLYRNLVKPYMAFFEKDFHPWKHDNSHLIAEWKANHAPEEYAEAAVEKLVAEHQPSALEAANYPAAASA